MKKRSLTKTALIRCSFCHQNRGLAYATQLIELEKVYDKKYFQTQGASKKEGWALKAAIKQKLIWACDICLATGQAISAKPWLQIPSQTNPEFAYSDTEVLCSDCGKTFVFSADEQQYWYEQLKFVRFSTPKFCITCRRKRRIYKRHFHDLQRALASLDAKNSMQLAKVAELYLQIGHFQKALEFFRRAKNRALNNADRHLVTRSIQQAQQYWNDDNRKA